MNRIRVRPDLITQDLGNELIIINAAQDIVCILNETGTAIFKALRETLEATELIRRLAESYRVPPETIEDDVNEYLQHLNDQGVLQWID